MKIAHIVLALLVAVGVFSIAQGIAVKPIATALCVAAVWIASGYQTQRTGKKK